MTNYLAIVGPTGSGKSRLAFELAKHIDGEIVNCDSVQIYKGFDIGSAKASASEQAEVRHHLLDILECHQDFDGADYARVAKKTIQEIGSRKKTAIVVGGTGLYLRSLWGAAFHDLPTDPTLKAELKDKTSAELIEILQAKDAASAARIHPNDHFRLVRAVELVILTGLPVAESWKENSQTTFAPKRIIYLRPERQLLCIRIAERVDVMLNSGWIDEVEALLQKGCSPEAKPMQSIGYRQVVEFLHGKMSRAEMQDKIVIATRQYAKRQVTWFNKVEGAEVFTTAQGLSALGLV